MIHNSGGSVLGGLCPEEGVSTPKVDVQLNVQAGEENRVCKRGRTNGDGDGVPRCGQTLDTFV